MAREDRRRVLKLLGDGKISAEEADRLLEILDSGSHEERGSETVGRGESRVSSLGETFEDKVESTVITTVRNAVETARSVISEVPGSIERTDVIEEEASNRERREDSFRVEGIPTLEVENFNGRVEIVGDHEDGRVRVAAFVRHPDLVDYSVFQDGDRIVARTLPSGKRSFLGWRFLDRGAHIRINAPREARVEIRNSNGRVIMRGIEGEGTVRTSNGRIEVEDAKGKFGMSTSNSRVEASRIEGEFRLESSNGRITVRDGLGAFDVETSNGSIRFAGEILPRGESRLETSNGSITATLTGEPSLRLSAKTSNGSITCARDVEVRGDWKKRQLEGAIGGGEGLLTLKTSNGSITIE